jgi:hypothetical protein
MDWHLAGLANWSALVGVPGFLAWTLDGALPTHQTLFSPASEQSVEVRLIELAYRVIASESRCARCGAALERVQLATPSAPDHPPRTVSIVTTCSGWRRHVHVANADEVSNDLKLGPFRAV